MFEEKKWSESLQKLAETIFKLIKHPMNTLDRDVQLLSKLVEASIDEGASISSKNAMIKLDKWFTKYRKSWISCPKHMKCGRCKYKDTCEFQEAVEEFYDILKELTGIKNVKH